MQRACQPTGIGEAGEQSSCPSSEYTHTQGAMLAFGLVSAFFTILASLGTHMINMRTLKRQNPVNITVEVATMKSDRLSPYLSDHGKFGKYNWH